jgi:hypothetical protein
MPTTVWERVGASLPANHFLTEAHGFNAAKLGALDLTLVVKP